MALQGSLQARAAAAPPHGAVVPPPYDAAAPDASAAVVGQEQAAYSQPRPPPPPQPPADTGVAATESGPSASNGSSHAGRTAGGISGSTTTTSSTAAADAVAAAATPTPTGTTSSSTTGEGAGAGAGGSRSGGRATGSLAGRLRQLRALGKSQRSKGADSGDAVGGASRAGNKSGAGAGAAQKAAPRVEFYGTVEQDKKSGGWVLRGFNSDLEALTERLPLLQARLRAAVKAEQKEQQRELRQLYASSSLERLRQDGIVLCPLRASPQGVELGQMIWKLTSAGAEGRDLPYHKFKAGDSVLIKRHAPAGATPQQRGRGMARGGPATSSLSDDDDGDDYADGYADDDDDAESGGAGAGGGSLLVSATVQAVHKKHVLVAMDKGDSDSMQDDILSSPSAVPVDWRMDQAENDATSKRQLEAIRRLSTMQDSTHPAFEQLARCCFVGTPSAHAISGAPPLWVRNKGWRADAAAHLRDVPGLNASQRRAVVSAMIRSVTLWQGPPGTGKTATLLGLIQVLVSAARGPYSASARGAAARGVPAPSFSSSAAGEAAAVIAKQRWAAMGPVLASANTNAATDNILEGLAARGVRVVRVGQPAKVREALRHLSLEALAEATDDGRRAVELRKTSKELFEAAREAAEGATSAAASWTSLTSSSRAAGRPGGPSGGPRAGRSGEGSRALEMRARAEWGKAEELMRGARQEILNTAEVVCATCSGAGDSELGSRIFRMVVIDEASQATEPATLVPLTRGAHCVVLAGDPCQLPPTIVSRVAEEDCGLDVTLFERMVDAGVEKLLLDTQYRMHPAIAEFPSAHFYEGKLKSGVTAQQRPPARGLSWPDPSSPVVVLRVGGVEERADQGGSRVQRMAAQALADQDGGGGRREGSYRNLLEARVALWAVEALAQGGDLRSIALLTPYRGQVRALERALRALGPDWLPPGVELFVSSVDAFQGREADAVVFSAVRCNPRGRVGFVSDPRRLNVAITRPRRALAVVCCPRTLAAGSRHWEAFMAHAAARGAVAAPEGVLPDARGAFGGMDPFAPSGLWRG